VHALGEAQDDLTGVWALGYETLRHGVQVADVVLDLIQAIFASHPRGADPMLGTMRPRCLVDVEPRKALRSDQNTGAVVQGSKPTQEALGELPVPVAAKPDLAGA
jgi:hypothetical protein